MTPLATATLPSLASTRVCGEDSTDIALVAALRRGDDRAFEQLYARYHRRISTYVAGMVRDHGRTEDITQEVFLSALRRMRETERPIAFKPWIYEIAKNACIDQFRRTRRTEEVSYDAGDGESGAEYGQSLASGSTPETAVDGKLALDNLCGAFGGLSETHHQILVMRELEGLSYSQIGERLGMSRPAVESTLFRARRRLAVEYEELVTGERCLRVQAIIAGATAVAPGARDRRRVAVHVSHCQPCRRHAHAVGMDVGTLTAGALRRARIAAFLPLPAFLRRRGSSVELSSAAGTAHGGTLAQWSAQASAALDPTVVSSWVKAAAAAATVAVVGVGAGHTGSHAPVTSAGHAAAPATQLPQTRPVSAPRSRPAATRPLRATAKTPSRGAVRTPLIAVRKTGIAPFRPAVPPSAAAAPVTHGGGPQTGGTSLGALRLPLPLPSLPTAAPVSTSAGKLLGKVQAVARPSLGAISSRTPPLELEKKIPETVTHLGSTVGETVVTTGNVVTQVTGIVVGR
jgi:RNA polymerase sigma factor (sigma-70 family)